MLSPSFLLLIYNNKKDLTTNNLGCNIKLLVLESLKKRGKQEMYDTIIRSGNSQLQHGPSNDRIYLMDLDKDDMPEILDILDEMADAHSYTKIFAKVPQALSREFLKRGYLIEARVPNFFNGHSDCVFLGKFNDIARSIPVDEKLNSAVIETANAKANEKLLDNYELSAGFSFKKAKPRDVYQMAQIYSKVFNSYPFPVSDPDYLLESMKDNQLYFTIWKEDQIIALSACEVDKEDESVEMTDFAVLPAYRGHKLSGVLLKHMEIEMKKIKMKTAYTIARSCSYGMNSIFAKGGYCFSGRLIKNTQIGGKIEDMNVWYKSL